MKRMSLMTELFYATAGIDITQMHRQESEDQASWWVMQKTAFRNTYVQSALQGFICSMMR